MGELGTKLGLDELTGGAAGISRALLAEFIGNLLLNLFGCGACINISQGTNAAPDIVLIALAFGLAVFAAVSAIGHISGGHINPAVTLGLASVGRVKPARAVLYIIAQCAGAAAGSGLLKALTPDRAAGKLGVTGLGTDVTQLQGFGIEFFLGFVLIFVVCGVCDSNKPDHKSTAPLAIGLTVTLGHLLAVDYTGSAMNPARSFGSALVANEWVDHWVYWAGPIAGGVAAALLYVHGFSAPPVETVTPPRYRAVAGDEKEVCDSNKPDHKSTAPLAIGLTVTLGHLLAVDYTGSAMNPARSFGSALVANEWVDHWVYWAGPIAGGVAAALLYVHGFSAPPVETVTPPRYRAVAGDEKELKRLDGKADDLA